MKRARDLDTPVDWLVRAAHNRCLPDSDCAKACADDAAGELEFVIPARYGCKARKVRQQLWASRVVLPAGKDAPVSVTCIVARECDAPDGVKLIEWRLLTNRSADTAESIVELIDWYRARWEIEMYFHIVKTGCRVEQLQIESVNRIERALGLYLMVAWRIHYPMRL